MGKEISSSKVLAGSSFKAGARTRIISLLLLCVFIPLAFVFFFVNQQAYTSLERSMLENNSHTLMILSKSLDDIFTGIVNIRNDMLLNNDLLNSYSPSDYANTSNLQRTLKQYTNYHPKPFEIFLHTESDRYVFSSSSSYTRKTLQHRFGLADDQADTVMRNTLTQLQILPVYDTYYATGCLLFIMPVESRFASRTLMIEIYQSEFVSLLQNVLRTADGEIWIFDRDFSELLHSEETLSSVVQDYILHHAKELISQDNSVDQQIEIEGTGYYINRYHTERFGILLLHMIPIKTAALQAIEQRNKWTILFSSVFVFTACVILLVSYLTNAPIKQLMKHISGSGEDEDTPRSGLAKRLFPEANYIISYINQIEDSNSQLTLHIQELHKDWYQTLFTRFLLGEIHSWDNLSSLTDSHDFFSQQPGYFLFAIQSRDYMINSQEIHMIADACQISSNMVCITMQFSDYNIVVGMVVLSSCAEFDQNTFVYNVTPRLQTLLKQTFSMGICRICTEIDQAQQALIEAVSACNHAYSISPEKTTVLDFAHYYESSWFTQIQNAFPDSTEIQQMDINMITDTLGKIRTYFYQPDCDAGNAKYLSYRILNWLNEAVSMLTQEEKINLYTYIERIIGYDNIRDIDQFVQFCSQELLEKIAMRVSEHQDVLFNRLMTYIECHISDVDFSLTTMANHFSMSIPIISKYFKDHTGSSVMNYMVLKRIEKSCELLLSTKLSVKEIGLQVGYINDSSYIRRFKSVMGISPGQYRMEPDKYKIPSVLED